MGERITVNHLKRAVAVLARESGLPENATRKTAEGRIEFVPRALGLDIAYGGYRLVQYVGMNGGESTITDRRHTARELYDIIHAIREFNNRQKYPYK